MKPSVYLIVAVLILALGSCSGTQDTRPAWTQLTHPVRQDGHTLVVGQSHNLYATENLARRAALGDAFTLACAHELSADHVDGTMKKIYRTHIVSGHSVRMSSNSQTCSEPIKLVPKKYFVEMKKTPQGNGYQVWVLASTWNENPKDKKKEAADAAQFWSQFAKSSNDQNRPN